VFIVRAPDVSKPTGNRVIHWKGHAGLPFRWQIGHQQVRPDRVPHWFIKPNAHCLDFSERRKANRQSYNTVGRSAPKANLQLLPGQPAGRQHSSPDVVIECQSACAVAVDSSRGPSTSLIIVVISFLPGLITGHASRDRPPRCNFFCRQASTEVDGAGSDRDALFLCC